MPVLHAPRLVALSHGCVLVDLAEPDGAERGPPLLLSNSLAADRTMWDPQREAFAAGRRVVRYDARGHGGSDTPPQSQDAPWTIESMADDALALLDALGLEQVDWCGLSLGGMVGMAVARLAPRRVRRLVLANAAALMPPAALWNGRILSARRGGMGALVEPTIERWFTPPFRARGGPALDAVRAAIAATPVDGYVGCCAAIRDMNQSEAIRAISAPTLVIVGAHDAATTPADGALIAERVGGARLVTLDAAHLSNVEQPDAFTQAVLGFLDAA